MEIADYLMYLDMLVDEGRDSQILSYVIRSAMDANDHGCFLDVDYGGQGDGIGYGAADGNGYGRSVDSGYGDGDYGCYGRGDGDYSTSAGDGVNYGVFDDGSGELLIASVIWVDEND